MLISSLLFSAFVARVFCQAQVPDNSNATLSPSTPCDPSKSHLDPLTHHFLSDCSVTEWCAPLNSTSTALQLAAITPRSPSLLPNTTPNATEVTTGSCQPKGCRRDEYPFGYGNIPMNRLPPLCDLYSFCPDDESACKSLVQLGGSCELNRDDQCASPQSANVSSSSQPLPSPVLSRALHRLFRRQLLQVPLMASGDTDRVAEAPSANPPQPICLASVCRLAAATLGTACLIDHTGYLGYDSKGNEVVDTVSRDDCIDGLYCDDSTATCMQEKPVGASCASDRECQAYRCNPTSLICEIPPEAPRQVPVWAFALIALFILAVLLGLSYSMYRLHLSHRAMRDDEISQYFSEQWTYRQSILAMHAAALSGGADGHVHDEKANVKQG